MRLLYVVQRYGRAVPGGAEAYCRELAEHAAARGHQVEVLASCARDYLSWSDAFAPGTTVEHGVTVHRLPVRRPRKVEVFGYVNRVLSQDPTVAAPPLQEWWAEAQGPDIDGLEHWLDTHAPRFDIASFVTYSYTTANAGLPVAARHVPAVLHPTAHDEPTLWLPLFDRMFARTSGFVFLTPEERDLFSSRHPITVPAAVIGVGTELDPAVNSDDILDGGSRLRREHGLGDAPYLLFLGRVDPAKGSTEVLRYFAAYKERNPGPLKFVVVGEPVIGLEPHPDLVITGFVDEAVKYSALSGSVALVQPSYFESFSMALTESWLAGRPALVQAACAVLDGQVRRSGGGVPYRDYPEFEAAVNLLLDDRDRADRMGLAGRRYTREQYSWSVVMDAYEGVLEEVRSAASSSMDPPGPAGRAIV